MHLNYWKRVLLLISMNFRSSSNLVSYPELTWCPDAYLNLSVKILRIVFNYSFSESH